MSRIPWVGEIVHWEEPNNGQGKLLCGASIDIEDDRFLLNVRYEHHVTCPKCIAEYKRPTIYMADAEAIIARSMTWENKKWESPGYIEIWYAAMAALTYDRAPA